MTKAAYPDTAAFRRALVRDDLTRMNLPEGFWRAKVQQVPESLRATIVRYMHRLDEMVHRPAGLLLWGGVGVGKSGAAAVVAKEARARGYTVYFVPVWELREDIRSRTMFDDTTTTLDRCRQVDLLVLDGLRGEDAKQPMFGARELEDLLSARANRRRPTLLTTQLAPRAFRDCGLAGAFEAMRGTLVALEVTGENRREAEHKDLVASLAGDAADPKATR